MAASAFSVRGWTFCRPSAMTQTTIFCQPSLPQVRDLVREQKWAMFLMMPCMVRVNSISPSLYMVTQMKSSVSRMVGPMFWRNLYPFTTKSSGSQVTAVYRMCVNSRSSLRGRKLCRIVGILHSRINSPLINRTSFLITCASLNPRRSCLPSGAGPYKSIFSAAICSSSSVVKVESVMYECADFKLALGSLSDTTGCPPTNTSFSDSVSGMGMVVSAAPPLSENSGAGGRGLLGLPPYCEDGVPGRGLPLMSGGS
jgi:hypothetical protein